MGGATTPTPLSHAVLLALADGELHGYGIIKAVVRQSEGRLAPGTGTLYTALARLEEEGLIEESGREPGPGEDRRRRYWRLTSAGREAARVETLRLARLVALARDKAIVAEPDLLRSLGGG